MKSFLLRLFAPSTTYQSGTEFYFQRAELILRLAQLSFGLSVVILLLSSCLSSGGKVDPDLAPDDTGDEAILSGLPSISELAGTPAPEIRPLPILAAGEIALGQEIYDTHCASCHGQELEGEPDWQTQNDDGSFRAPPHDDSGHTWHHGDKLLIESIRLGGTRLSDNIGGISEMPAFADVLSDDEMIAVLTYIKSTWPDDIRTIQWEQTVREP